MYRTSSQESRAKTEQAIVADGKVISQFKAQFNWAWLNSVAAAPALETVYQTELTELQSSHHFELTEASAVCDVFIDINTNKCCLKFWHTLSLLFLVPILIKSIWGWVAFVRNWAHNIFLSNAFLLDISLEGSTSLFHVQYTFTIPSSGEKLKLTSVSLGHKFHRDHDSRSADCSRIPYQGFPHNL